MALFDVKPGYDRRALLEEAARSEARGKTKRAIAAYTEILEQEPGDHVVQGKLAPLLAKSGQEVASWNLFRASAEGYCRDGFQEKAISLYKRAAAFFPRRYTIWERIVDLQLQAGRSGDALATLMQAITHFKGRKQRLGAVVLLHRAHAIIPDDPRISLDYGRSLLRAGRRDEGALHLDQLCRRLRGGELRRARGCLLRAHPSPGCLWRWLRAAAFGR